MNIGETFQRRAQSGANYDISLWVPPGRPPAGGWPVVYVLDANAIFATFVEALKRSGRRPDATGIGLAAVVGIGHVEDELTATECRYRDYTFEPSAQVKTQRSSGGALFLDFITNELAPELAAKHALNPERQALFGHSLAGYFVLNALALRPGAFGHYAAISPSVWWQAEALSARLDALTPEATHGIHGVLIAAGEWEGEPAPWLIGSTNLESVMQRRRERQMIARARAMSERLAQILDERRVSFRCFPEEDHASIVMIAVQRSLRLMFAV